MDLKDLKPKVDDITVTIVHPSTGETLENKDGSPMTITMYAKHSKEYKAYTHSRTNENIAKSRKSGKPLEFRAEDLEAEEINLFANTTKSWDITYDGKKTQFSVDKAKEIYNELFWIREQLDDTLTSEDVFT